MKRQLSNPIKEDLAKKMVLLMGPRQTGKTTLAKALQPEAQYFNYDSETDRKALSEQSWDRSSPLVIFDEIHKMPEWKRWLKGIYDTEGLQPNILVTGSAKLDTFRKVGDSLAGRYFSFTLHPLDLKELLAIHKGKADEFFEQLWNCSGFPEPFLKGTTTFYKRWRRTHLDIILRQDLIDQYAVRDLRAIEHLTQLLKQRVGGSISYSNLARDLQKDVKTIQQWLLMLENLYIIYRVTPYSKSIARSLLKEPKFYFYDHNNAENNDGAKLENIVANALLKELDYIAETLGAKTSLHYLRTKDGKEVDFLVCIDDNPTHMIEVKSSDDEKSKSFAHFKKFLTNTKQLQLVKNIKRDKTFPDGVEIRSLIKWLAKIDFSGLVK
jgi:predicted AAA+ superfamily ATPase